jgi:hypothetical protein
MKTILLLNDKTESAKPTLQSIPGTTVILRPSEGNAGCNCDRWGHPCPSCLEYNVQLNADLPISSPAKATA